MNLRQESSGTVAPSPGSLRCFIINLRPETRRLSRISQSLRSQGMEFEVCSAIDGRRFPKLVKKMFPVSFSPEKGRELTAGEMACSLSHISVLRKIVKRKLPGGIILEDDAEFSPEFSLIAKRDLPCLLKKIGIVKLEGITASWTSQTGPKIKLGSNHEAITPLRPSLGAAAYAISNTGAKAILAAFHKHSFDPYDHILTEYERHWARYAELRPFIAFQLADTHPSTLNHDRARAERVMTKIPASKIKTSLRRANRLLKWGRELLTQHKMPHRIG